MAVALCMVEILNGRNLDMRSMVLNYCKIGSCLRVENGATSMVRFVLFVAKGNV